MTRASEAASAKSIPSTTGKSMPITEEGMMQSASGKQPKEERIRVLFVDNSVVLRTALKELFKQEDALEALTSSPAIDVTLLNIAKSRPHLAVLDADGDWDEVAALLKAIRAEHRSLAVVLMTANEASEKQILERGKPFGVKGCWVKTGGFRNPGASVRQYLLAKTATALTAAPPPGAIGLAPVPARKGVNAGPAKAAGKKTVIVIGVSTGGPDALSILLPLLPEDLGVPVLIVQHTLAAFTGLLVERLQKRTSLTVLEAQDGMPVAAGQIVVAPGNRHMQLTARGGQIVVVLDDGPPENSCRPAVDPLFRSAARVYGAHALGIILTGMGQDGLMGCRDLKRTGATIVVQDEQSSTVWGMPGQVAQAGLANSVLDLKEIAVEIVRQVGVRPRARLQA